tara:strand:- start:73 stop:339 length:267 start_codon:yes stop_codon:yes gene_type:complete
MELIDINKINNINKLIKENQYDIIQNMVSSLNDDMNELYDLLNDIKTNNVDNLKEKVKEQQITKQTLEPFMKYYILYNIYLRNTYNGR